MISCRSTLSTIQSLIGATSSSRWYLHHIYIQHPRFNGKTQFLPYAKFFPCSRMRHCIMSVKWVYSGRQQEISIFGSAPDSATCFNRRPFIFAARCLPAWSCVGFQWQHIGWAAQATLGSQQKQMDKRPGGGYVGIGSHHFLMPFACYICMIHFAMVWQSDARLGRGERRCEKKERLTLG